jgi:hypothetical protein
MDFKIDFDEASNAWMKNKKKLGDGMYTYICGCQTKSGKPCQRKPQKNETYCFNHKKK